METTPNKDLELDKLATSAKEQASDRGVEQRFFTLIYRFVHHVCGRTVASRPSRWPAIDVDDLVQTVCMKIWMSLHRFDSGKGHFSTWVWTIARRSWMDLTCSPENAQRDGVDAELEEQTSGFDERAVARLSLAAIEDALPSRTFELIVMSATGHSAQDIAAMQGANVDTVKSRIRVARRRAVSLFEVVAA